MTTDRDFDRIASAWLDLMPSEAPDRVIDAVIQAAGTTPQVRRPILLGGRRNSSMTRFALIAAVAALGVALLGGAVLLGGARRADTVPEAPAPTALAPASSEPSAAAGGPADAALRAMWIADASPLPALGSAAGPVTMHIDETGTRLGPGNFGAGSGLASAVEAVGPDALRLTLDGLGSACSSGDVGTYRWSLSDDRSLLTLTAVDDQCAVREAAIARTWGRSLTSPTSVGAGFVNTMDPPFRIVLPDLSYQPRTLNDFVEVPTTADFSLMVFKNPQPFVDACSTAEERVPWKPGAAAFVEAFRANDAFEVSEATPLTIDGHDALHVNIRGKADYARCPGQALYEYTPKTCNCHFIVGQGDADSMYLVDVGEDTFMFIVSPFEYADEHAVIDSIRIPATIPSQ